MSYHQINNKLILIFFVFITLMLVGCSEKQDKTTQSVPDIQSETTIQTDTTKYTETDIQTETTKHTETTKQSLSQTNDYIKYLGRWYNSEGTCSVNIISLDNDSMHFSFEVGSEVRVAEVEETVGTVEENTIQFDFTDGWHNKGQGTIILNENNNKLNTNITDANPEARFWASIDTELFRKNDGENNEYIFYDSNIRYLTENEILGLSTREMLLARNEIYARHGRLFKDADLQDYFNSQEWYYGSVDADIFDSDQELLFNEFENSNIALIKKIEQEQSDAQSDLTEKEYYNLIKETWQRQRITSILLIILK